MKTSIKKAVSAILSIIMICSMMFCVSAAGEVKINIFGENVELPEGYGAPYIDVNTSRTLVPARGVFEAMGATVSWEGSTRTVTIVKDSYKIEVVIDAGTALKNGEQISLDQPAVIVDDRTYIPLRFVAESLDLDVDFDGSTTTVIIDKKAPAVTEFVAGKYAVGTDLVENEYLLVSEGSGSVKLLRAEDSSDLANVISTISFKNSIYLNVIGAKYIETTNCKMYSLTAAPQRGQNGVYKNGMFKVGKDFAAGSYALSKITSSENASYKIYGTPFSTAGTNQTIKEAALTKATTVSLTAGQYITLDNVKLEKKAETSGSTGGGGGGGGSVGGGGGGSSSGGGGHRPGGNATKPPADEPTEEPTERPTEKPTDEPTETPAPSENEFYEGYEDLVLDFGNFFWNKGVFLALVDYIEIEDEDGTISYVYSYDASYFKKGDSYNDNEIREYVRKMKEKYHFGETYEMDSLVGTHYLSKDDIEVRIEINDGVISVTITSTTEVIDPDEVPDYEDIVDGVE